MQLRYKDDVTGEYVRGDDGGFDVRRVAWSRDGDHLVGRVRSPSDDLWGMKANVSDLSEEAAKRMIEMSFRCAAARWLANR
jgi:hypothetical protein